jgi:hypothetical protein
MEGHVHLCDKNALRERKAIRNEFEDTKGVNRIRKSKKDKQHNGLKKKYKGTNNYLQNTANNNDLQSTTQKTNDRST